MLKRARAVLFLGLLLPAQSALAEETGPSPMFKASQGVLESTVLDAARTGLGPVAGPVVYYGYKAQDVLREIGEAAVDEEDRTHDAEFLSADKDTALLHELNSQGVDLNADPRALEAKDRLYKLRDAMYAGDLSATGYLRAVMKKNLLYAVTEVGVGKAVDGAFDAVFGSARVKQYVGDRRLAGPGTKRILGYEGWGRFALRDEDAKKFVSKFVRDTAAHAVDEAFKAELDKLAKKIITRDADTVFESREPIAYMPQRLVLARLDLPVPAMAAAVAPPAAAAPAPVAAPPPDPVTDTIRTENYNVRIYHQTYTPSQSAPPPPAAPVQESWHPSPEWQAHWDAAGAGRQSGASWDGRSGCTLTSGC